LWIGYCPADAWHIALDSSVFLLLVQAEELGNEGNVDEAKAKSTECDQLRVECQKLQQVIRQLRLITIEPGCAILHSTKTT
jgi:hypothetical protein